ncbi:unnamed protein product [Rotaria magnacalcarata]
MSTSFNNTDRLNNNLNQLRTLLNDQRSDNSINTRNTLIPLGPVINNSIPARIDTLLQLDDSSWRNLYYIPLKIINIMILIIGLYKAGNKSNEMNAYNFISICLLVINVIDLLLLLELIIRNNMSLNDILSDLSTSPFKSIVYLRTFLVIVSFPLTSIGTYCMFTSVASANNEIEYVRVSLGVVCVTQWFMWFCPLPKLSLPGSNTTAVEITIFLRTIIDLIYISTVLPASFQVHDLQCTYKSIEDLYLHAPLNSFARIGLILIIVLCGGGLIFCLPSRIRAPLMMMFQQWLNATPLQMGIHLGASKESINALPIIYFGRTLDPFNQKKCCICHMEFESNEKLKRLPCGHFFHDECTSQWLVIRSTCPVCRKNIM